MAAVKMLQNQLKKIYDEPVEGFTVELQSDTNMFAWNIYIEGPKDTPYAGGIFKLAMTFPNDFPMSPPTLRFVSEFWHPNVYPDGKVCISILHPPGHDEMSGERPEERWLPTQSVTTVVLSVLSMLGDPNFSSPANVDASVEWRRKPEEFKKRVAKLIEKAKKDVPAGLKIPHPDTDPEERRRALAKQKALSEDTFDIDEADYAEADYGDADLDASDLDGDGDDDLGDEDEEEEEEEERPKPKPAAKAAPKEEKKAEATSGGKADATKAADATKSVATAKPSAPAASVVPAAAPAAVTVSVAAVAKGKEERRSEGKKEEKEKKEKKGKEKKEKKAKKEAGSPKDKAAKGKDEKEDALTHSSKKAKTAEQESAKKLK